MVVKATHPSGCSSGLRDGMETYYGHVSTPADAIILFETCRVGILPRVQQRLSEKECQPIRSVSVFVWDEQEANMRQWTDSKSWSASQVSGSLLTYREMEGKRGCGSSFQTSIATACRMPESWGSYENWGNRPYEGLDGYKYKPDGLIKQSFSTTSSTGQHLHMVSYYSLSHFLVASLQKPISEPALQHVRPQSGLYPKQNHSVITRGPVASASYPFTSHLIGANAARTTTSPSDQAQYPWQPTPLATPPTASVAHGAIYSPPISAPNGSLSYEQPQHRTPLRQRPNIGALSLGLAEPSDCHHYREAARTPASPLAAGPRLA